MSDAKTPGQFPSTHWSIIVRLRSGDEKQHGKAVDEIFRTYRYPLYGYLRSTGMQHEDAEDLLQDFFSKMLRTESLRGADQDRGRLRAFLLHCLSNLRINWHHHRERRRGPERTEADLWGADEARWQREKQGTGETPELFFERRWAMELVTQAKVRLRQAYAGRKSALCEALLPLLPLEEARAEESQRTLAIQLGLTENALRVALHRLRANFRDCLLDEVRLTVDDDADVKAEVSYLMGLFQKR